MNEGITLTTVVMALAPAAEVEARTVDVLNQSAHQDPNYTLADRQGGGESGSES